MIKPLVVLVIVALVISPHADAATKTPSPTAKATATPTPKATATKKAVIKKKVTTKKKAKNSLSPSPKPKWPPVGFKSNGEVYAKIPTAKELIGTASSSKVLTAQLGQLVDGVRICEKYSCGAVQIASLNGCTWWEVNAKLVGETSADDLTQRTFGTIQVLANATKPKQIITILLISQELLTLKHVVRGISIKCHHDPSGDNVPSSTYTAVNN